MSCPPTDIDEMVWGAAWWWQEMESMFSCLCKDGLDSRLGLDAAFHSPAAIDTQSQVH